MTSDDREMAELRRRLAELQRRKAKKRPKRAVSIRPRGRPRVPDERVENAKTLASEGNSIPDVALVTNISTATLWRRGIRRYRLNREKKDQMAAGTKS